MSVDNINKNPVWTPRDDEKLIKLRAANVPVADIADIFDRSVRSVQSRLERLKALGQYTPIKSLRTNGGPHATEVSARSAIDGSRRLLNALLRFYDKRAAA